MGDPLFGFGDLAVEFSKMASQCFASRIVRRFHGIEEVGLLASEVLLALSEGGKDGGGGAVVHFCWPVRNSSFAASLAQSFDPW